MNPTIRGRDLKTTAATALLALVILLAAAFAAWPVITGNDSVSDPAPHARSAGGASIAEDPYIDRHAEVAAHYHEGGPR